MGALATCRNPIARARAPYSTNFSGVTNSTTGKCWRVGCDLLTLGQYLQPTLKHLPVVEFVTPQKFAEYGARAREMGFRHVASAPMVRSSYHADEFNLSTPSSPPPLPASPSAMQQAGVAQE